MFIPRISKNIKNVPKAENFIWLCKNSKKERDSLEDGFAPCMTFAWGHRSLLLQVASNHGNRKCRARIIWGFGT